jgi:DNA (cytosine-5)-methyltransferase 1
MSSIASAQLDRAPVAVDLFSGCGGLSCGLKIAGFRVAAAVEIDAKARHTYSLNHPEVLLLGDVRLVDPNDLLERMGLRRGELDLLAGCPPCQGFSRLRTRNKRTSVPDPRNELVSQFLRFVESMLPKSIMLENVPSLSKDRRFTRICRALTLLGYEHTFEVLDAADYDVPQRRKRLILLASRVHRPRIASPSSVRRTVRHAIGGLEAPYRSIDQLHRMGEKRSARVKQLIARIPKDGGSRRDAGPAFQLLCHQRSNGFGDVYGRMAWDDVAPTITSGCHNPSKGRFLHPSRNRTITLREAALLQGFPQSYLFDIAHGKEAIALMIGNALPPPFIAAHASALSAGIFARS